MRQSAFHAPVRSSTATTPAPTSSAPSVTGRSDSRRGRRRGPLPVPASSPAATASRRGPTCHHTSAAPARAATSQRLPGARPEARLREREDAEEGEQREADDPSRPVAVMLERRRGERVLGALVGDDEPGRDVEQDAGPAGERERGERDPIDDGVELEVLAEPGADAAEPAAVVRPRQRSVAARG